MVGITIHSFVKSKYVCMRGGTTWQGEIRTSDPSQVGNNFPIYGKRDLMRYTKLVRVGGLGLSHVCTG